jgi:hypothetical protein
VQPSEYDIPNVIDETYGQGSKLFGDILRQIMIAVEFHICPFLVREFKPYFEGFGAGTLDLDLDAELHCHVAAFSLLPCPIARRAAP